MSKIKAPYLIFLSFTFLGLYHLSVTQENFQFLKFQKINWVQSANCPEVLSNFMVQGSNRFKVLKIEGNTKCNSHEIKNSGNAFSLEYRGIFSQGDITIFPNNEKKVFQSHTLVSSNDWQKLKLTTIAPQSFQIQASIKNSNKNDGWLEIRERLEEYQRPTLLNRIGLFFNVKNSRLGKAISSSLASLAIIFLFFVFIQKQRHPLYLFVTFLIISLLVHFRWESFFYFDEWHVIQRFSEQGISSIFHPHNEHFLPLFFLIYDLESLFFGSKYELFLLLSHILHALNAVLIYTILKELLPKNKDFKTSSIALILSLLFVINSNHAEALQWAFIQSVLMAHTAIFIGIYSAIRFVKTGKRIFIPLCYLPIGLSPFFFANGFIAPFLLIVIITAYVLSQREKTKIVSYLQIHKQLFIKTFAVIFLTAIAYFFAETSETSDNIQIHRELRIADLSRYILSGALLGTILRSIGLFPSLQLEAVEILSNKLPAPILSLARQCSSIEAFFWIFALIFCTTLLFFAYKQINRRHNLILFISGFAWIVLFFILPALGRAQLGPSQALALRYHYGSIFGLLLMIYPVVFFLYKKPKLLTFFAFLILSVHFYVEAGFSWYSNIGLENRAYISKLKDWREKTNIYKKKPFRFDAKGTSLHGQQPKWIYTLTTGVNSEIIYDTVKWLEKDDSK